MQPGHEIQVLDGKGAIFSCRILQIGNKSISAEIVKRQVAAVQSGFRVTVLLPLLKGGRFEWALEKLTELGVAKIVPVIFSRSVVRTKGSAKLDHWQAVLKESAEQCERAVLPEICEPRELQVILQEGLTTAPGWFLVCAERSGAPLLGSLVHSRKDMDSPPENIVVVVGPEGGITGDELQKLENFAFQKVSLGSTVLRSETAAIAALAQIMGAAKF